MTESPTVVGGFEDPRRNQFSDNTVDVGAALDALDDGAQQRDVTASPDDGRRLHDRQHVRAGVQSGEQRGVERLGHLLVVGDVVQCRDDVLDVERHPVAPDPHRSALRGCRRRLQSVDEGV